MIYNVPKNWNVFFCLKFLGVSPWVIYWMMVASPSKIHVVVTKANAECCEYFGRLNDPNCCAFLYQNTARKGHKSPCRSVINSGR